jgi:hypothetical protein
MVPFEAGVAVVLSVALTLPHLLSLRSVRPATAALVWLSALAVRALMAIGGAVLAFVYMPQTGVYDAVAHWCWHEIIPVLTAHLGLSGHPVIHAATVLPGLALAASLLWLIFGFTRAWLLLRSRLRKAVGEGPLGSTVIEDQDVVVGVPQVGRGRIVVSRGAFGVMDPCELEASLSHELGHINRRHRPLLLLGAVLAALGRLLPGTAQAERELRFSLERDADEYAVRRTRDPLALASAICKAATAPPLTAAVALGGEGRIALRLDYLSGQAPRASRAFERTARLLGLGLALIAVALSATLPAWALAMPSPEHTLSAAGSHCPAQSQTVNAAIRV